MKTLKEKFPDLEFFTPKEAAEKLNWTFEEDDKEINNIKCCGEFVEIVAFVGPDYAYCAKCGKGIQNIAGLHHDSPVTMGLMDLDDVDMKKENKHWYIVQMQLKKEKPNE